MSFSSSYAAAAEHWPPGTESTDVATGWGTTHVLAAGPPEGELVVLLHGDGATATAWAGVARALGDRYRVVAPDQPGNPGRSRSGRRFRSTADLVSWVDELTGRFGDRPVHLVGHSAGAHLALETALAHGARVATLTLLDPTSCFAGLRPGYLARALPVLVRPTPARVRRFLRWETGGRPLDAAWEQVYVAGATEFHRAPIVRTRRPGAARLQTLRVPVLVVVAAGSRAHDPRAVSRGAATTLSDVRVEEVAAATHHTMPVLDAGPLARMIAEHVAAHPTG